VFERPIIPLLQDSITPITHSPSAFGRLSFSYSFRQIHLLSHIAVRTRYLIIGCLLCGLLAGRVCAEAYKLTTGETLNGEVLAASANDQGVQVKIGEGQYQKVPWASFSQDDLKTFAKNQRMEPFVQPFIEPNPEEKIKRTEVDIKQPQRWERPPRQSLLGAMFSSIVGLFALLLVYGATIYAGYEVAIFRAQPPLLVAGLSAIPGLGILAPIIFLSMPTRLKGGAQAADTAQAAAPQAAAPVQEEVNPMHADGAAHPGALKLHTDAEEAKPAHPETITFQRGQFTFNRRFFETKFAAFFGVIRRDKEKDLVLVIKSSRGEFIGQRISRIAASDLHLQVQHGHATEEMLIPFQEIQEIRLKHKDA
jgi:hypothetical protein